MSAKPPQFLYFDLGNVLAHFDHARAVTRVAELTQVAAPRVHAVIFESGLQHDYETGRITSPQFCDRLRGELPARGPSPTDRQLLDACSDIFWLNHSIVPIVGQLVAARQPLGILSNTCEAHWQWLTQGRYRILHDRFFSLHILSYEVGAMKPDLPIYQVAIEAAGCQPSEIFFVDDRPENVAGARQAGLDAVLYKGAEPLIRDLIARQVRANF